MQQFRIEKATHQDLTPIAALVNSAYRGQSARQGWTHEADLIAGEVRTNTEELSKLLAQKDTVLLKCLEGENLVGSVLLQHAGSHLYLGMLSVAPQQQAKGVGRTLLQAAETYGVEKGYKAIVMTVISLREELLNWYSRNGYIPTGEKEPFPEGGHFGTPTRPLEFLVLKKDLSKRGLL